MLRKRERARDCFTSRWVWTKSGMFLVEKSSLSLSSSTFSSCLLSATQEERTSKDKRVPTVNCIRLNCGKDEMVVRESREGRKTKEMKRITSCSCWVSNLSLSLIYCLIHLDPLFLMVTSSILFSNTRCILFLWFFSVRWWCCDVWGFGECIYCNRRKLTRKMKNIANEWDCWC